MPHFHYVMDLYYANPANPKRPDHTVQRIDAESEESAIAEAKRIDGWRKPDSFRLRSITSGARSGDKVILESPAAEAEPDAPSVVSL